MADAAVRVDNLQTVRKALRQVDRDALKEVQQVTKRVAQIVADEAGRLAKRGTRPIPPSRRPPVRLADSYKATTSGSKGVVRSRLPYAAIEEFRRTGTPAQMRNVRPVGRAQEAKAGEVQRELADGFEDVLRRNGF